MDVKPFQVRYLGLVPYGSALALQSGLRDARIEGHVVDTLLLLQHPSVITMGRFRGDAEILAPDHILAEEGITLFHTNRGGSVTYHGPGQLVGYPIFNIKELQLGVRDYILKLEEVIIKTLQKNGIDGHRNADFPGSVWVGSQKICSMGISVKSYVSMHGFALNINNDLKYFNYINPCGIKGKNIMTSMMAQLGHSVQIAKIVDDLIIVFSETFGLGFVGVSEYMNNVRI